MLGGGNDGNDAVVMRDYHNHNYCSRIGHDYAQNMLALDADESHVADRESYSVHQCIH